MLSRIPKKYGHFIFWHHTVWNHLRGCDRNRFLACKSPKLLGDVLARMDDNGADRPVSSAVDPSNHRTCYL